MWINKGEGRWFYNPEPEMPTLDYFDHGKAEGDCDCFIALSQITPDGGRDLAWWMTHLSHKDWFSGRVAASFIGAAVEAGVVAVREVAPAHRYGKSVRQTGRP
jgi:hypothetical protein